MMRREISLRVGRHSMTIDFPIPPPTDKVIDLVYNSEVILMAPFFSGHSSSVRVGGSGHIVAIFVS